jgi:predicted ATPase
LLRFVKVWAAVRALGQELNRPTYLAWLTEAYQKVGQVEESLSTLEEAMEVVGRTEERWYEAELYRLKGELLLQSRVQSLESRVKEAEGCFQKAIEIACQQEAKSWELRAATSLARLWQQQGKKEAARQILGEIYGWFSEGFDTADLKEARVFLEELEG